MTLPDAYIFELANAKKDGVYCNWQEHLSRNKPNTPEGAMRNIVPLYRSRADASPKVEKLMVDREVFEEAAALFNRIDGKLTLEQHHALFEAHNFIIKHWDTLTPKHAEQENKG